ncbi:MULTISPECIES: condensation domain-containing protein [Sinorhizobium]|uniref:Condensation protein n=2 Tax=Sinorhizobium TaxID=28105 RepID=A0A2S3YS98_9HYPH|nr:MULTISPECIES: condensation domain-containing protein [Sinorhizobium]AUX80122.1 condensation domain-containing protein [Sinorhizobium fredii]PDT43494.1 condensation protein [Sinorhizobium sp. FG01]POH34494.1 condensation protein [Sinorhizobium americanum]
MKETNQAVPTTAPTVVAEFPCSQTQLRCWILDQMKPGNPALNVAVRWEVRGAIRSSAIEAAFRTVIQRHEILRTRFVEVGGRPCQQVVDQVDFRMSVIDLRNVPADQREARILSIGEETARAPFDLSQPCLFRVSLLMVENDRGFLLITAHQSCFDGWSIRVLGREVGEISAAIEAGRSPALPELPLQYGDFSLWQSEYLESYGFEAEKAFWRERLEGAPYFEVVPDHPRGPVKTTRGSILSVAKPVEFGERIDAASRQHRVSLYSFGAAVVSALLHRYAAADKVLFGSQVAGRDDTDLENLIGVFINNIVLRFDFPSDMTFADHLRSASEIVTAALNHHRMPFNKLVEMVNPMRDPSRNPLISVNFNLQKAFLEDQRYGGLELISAPSQSPGVIYDLSFMMIGRPSGWRMSIEYNADLFERRTIEGLLDLWQQIYEIVLERPSALLSSLIVPEREIFQQPEILRSVPVAEQVLSSHPSVAAAAVVPTDGGMGSYGFVTPVPNMIEPLDRLPETLMTYLRSQLATPAMPQGVSVLLNLPRKFDGTVDRDALTVPVKTAPAVQVTPAAGKTSMPIDERTKALAAIWSDVLDVREIAPGDNFFSLGGHSLLALRMLSAVRSKLGGKADLELLFKQPTFSGFAGAIFGVADGDAAAKDDNPWSVSVCREGTGPCSLYTLNHPFLYYRLANELDSTVSVYNANMFSADLDGRLASMSFEDIARRVVERMGADILKGPIAIMGLCVNGVLAMEVGRQLRERGADLRFTAVIDAWAPGFVRSQPKLRRLRWNGERRLKRLGYFTRKLLAGRIRLVDFLREFNFSLGLMKRIGLQAGAYSDEEEINARVTDLLVDAARSYRPAHADGNPVLLFRSEANHPRARKLLFGWGEAVAPDTEVFDLEGWHEDSLNSNSIKALAAIATHRFGGRSTN